MWLIFLYGPPAVGKLTVGRELESLTGIRLFHNHLTVDLLHSVFDFGSVPFVELREEIWLSVFDKAARHGTSLIFTFNPERTVRPDFPERAVSTVEADQGRVLFVSLTCPEYEIERRISSPSRSEFGKLDSKERYLELRGQGAFEFPAMPVDLELDTESLSPADSARRVQQRLSMGLSV